MNWIEQFNPNKVTEIRAASKVYLGAGAIDKISEIATALKKDNVKSVLLVTGKSAYKKSGAYDKVKKALDNNGIKFAVFDQVRANPTCEQVDWAVESGLAIKADAVIAIGGGSPIDAAKSVAILLEYPGKSCSELYEFKFIPEKALPIVAINLTHGTGSECDRFAVVSIPAKEYKPAIAYDCIYPKYSIDDPELTLSLSAEQTRFVSIDAVNHAIEAATSLVASPFTIMLAKEAIRLVADFLPKALRDPEDVHARYFLMYASLLAGISFDNGLLHYTHALEHPLSAVKPDLAHGLGLAMILPAVIEEIYPACPAVLSDILSPMVPGLDGLAGESRKCARGVEDFLFKMGIDKKLADENFNNNDVEKLVKLAQETPSLAGLLSVAPTPWSPEVIRNIYQKSLHRMV